ncbi:MAG: hypothetical protein U0822_13110 [Anaerolineae bacterium]
MSELPPVPLSLTDPRAVTANAGGELTPGQREAVAGQMRRIRGLLIFFLVSAILLVLIALPVWVAQEMSASPLALIIRLTLLAVIALVVLVTTWTGVQTRRIRADFGGPSIASAAGQVLWNESAYVADIGGRSLLPLRGAAMPPPGRYRFYYLAQSGWLLSAAPLQSADPTPAEVTTRLAQANGLLASALPANRAGSLGDGQARWLLRPLLGSALLIVAVAIVAIGASALAAAAGQPWLTVPVVLAAVMIVFSDAVRLVRTIRDAIDKQVLSVEGEVERLTAGSRSRPKYHYALGDMRFAVTAAGFDALDEEQRYRLYYVPHSERLANIEVLERIPVTAGGPSSDGAHSA